MSYYDPPPIAPLRSHDVWLGVRSSSKSRRNIHFTSVADVIQTVDGFGATQAVEFLDMPRTLAQLPCPDRVIEALAGREPEPIPASPTLAWRQPMLELLTPPRGSVLSRAFIRLRNGPTAYTVDIIGDGTEVLHFSRDGVAIALELAEWERGVYVDPLVSGHDMPLAIPFADELRAFLRSAGIPIVGEDVPAADRPVLIMGPSVAEVDYFGVQIRPVLAPPGVTVHGKGNKIPPYSNREGLTYYGMPGDGRLEVPQTQDGVSLGGIPRAAAIEKICRHQGIRTHSGAARTRTPVFTSGAPQRVAVDAGPFEPPEPPITRGVVHLRRAWSYDIRRVDIHRDGSVVVDYDLSGVALKVHVSDYRTNMTDVPCPDRIDDMLWGRPLLPELPHPGRHLAPRMDMMRAASPGLPSRALVRFREGITAYRFDVIGDGTEVIQYSRDGIALALELTSWESGVYVDDVGGNGAGLSVPFHPRIQRFLRKAGIPVVGEDVPPTSRPILHRSELMSDGEIDLWIGPIRAEQVPPRPTSGRQSSLQTIANDDGTVTLKIRRPLTRTGGVAADIVEAVNRIIRHQVTRFGASWTPLPDRTDKL